MNDKVTTIGIFGAPGSGKSIVAAKLYAELLTAGCFNTRLLTEEATLWLAEGNNISTIDDQYNVSIRQLASESRAKSLGFSPIVCDSALWLGKVYMEHFQENLGDIHDKEEQNKIEFINKLHQDTLVGHYTHQVYVPLWQEEVNKSNRLRLHDNKESGIIDGIIKHYVENSGVMVYNVPRNISERDAFIKDFAQTIKNGL